MSDKPRVEMKRDVDFKPAFEAFLKAHGDRPNQSNEIHGFCSGWIAHRAALRDDGWVSVKERMPDKGAHIVAFQPPAMMFVLWWAGDALVDGITHWRHLPEPPKEEKR